MRDNRFNAEVNCYKIQNITNVLNLRLYGIASILVIVNYLNTA